MSIITSTPPFAGTQIGDKTVMANQMPGLTNEAKITTGYARAKALGALYLYISANMLPYDASKVTPEPTILAIREGGSFNLVDVKAYGAYADDITDDAPAFANAVSFISAIQTTHAVTWVRPILYAPWGIYRTSLPIALPNGGRLLGDGMSRGTRIAARSNFVGTALVMSPIGGSLVDVQIMDIELGNDIAGVNGIYLDTCQQRTVLRNVLVNGGGVANVGGYGIKIDSSNIGGGGIHIGVHLDNVWVNNPGDHCLIINAGVGTIVEAFHGENMPAGKASIRIDGTGYGNAGNHHINSLHHESSAHTSFAVDVNAVASAPCTIKNVYSANHNATDTGVRFSASCAGNRVENITWGTNAIVDNNPQASKTLNDWHVPAYQQDSTLQQTGSAGKQYGSMIKRRVAYGGALITPNAQQFEIWEINSNSNPTINAPNVVYPPVDGQIIHVRIINTSGGAVTTTWNANFKLMGAWVDPATGKSRTTNFYYDGTNMWEFGRSVADQ